jgi:YebC/PmpR family DNA-binding regulatory protein
MEVSTSTRSASAFPALSRTESRKSCLTQGGKLSGHSKWSTIKRKKEATDSKRGAVFTKFGKEIAIAAREGGPDPETNFKLRLIVDKAKAANMPRDNIERAIRRGAGLDKAVALEEILYEGYGPHGVAYLVQVVTDNRLRAVSEMRRWFTKAGGALAETGSVAWQFESKGYISVASEGQDADTIFEAAVDWGADDVILSSEYIEIYTQMESFQTVREALEGRGIPIESAELTMVPKTTITLDEKGTFQNMTLINNLEELDDVQQVYTNLDISDQMMERYEAREE